MLSSHKKIKILHVLYSFNIGGLENGLVNLINHLPPELFSHSLCILAHGKKCAERVGQPVSYYELAKRPGNDPRIPFTIASIVSREKPDIVHTRNWVALLEGFFGSLMGGCCNLIHSEHGKEIEDTKKQPLRRQIAKKGCFILAKKIITVSESLRQEFINQTLCPAHKITSIVNGVDCTRFHPFSHSQKKFLRNKFDIPENAFVIGSVGRLAPIKNYDLMLSLCHVRKVKNQFFVIVGDGPERERLERKAAQMGISNIFRFMGEQSNIHEVLNVFDVFLNTSFYEGISNTILEAMASGIPILAGNVGGNAEIVCSGQNGFIIKNNLEQEFMEYLLRLSNDEAFKNELSEKTAAYARQQYSLDAMVRQYQKIYSELVKYKN